MIDPARIRQRTLFAATALVLLTAGFITIRTGRDALYLQQGGLFGLPKAYVATAILSVPQAMGVLWMLRRGGTRVARVLMLACVADGP